MEQNTKTYIRMTFTFKELSLDCFSIRFFSTIRRKSPCNKLKDKNEIYLFLIKEDIISIR